MTNLWNLIYLGLVFVGTDLQVFHVIYDTGSGAFLLRTSDCTGCNAGADRFDIAASSTFNYVVPAQYDRVRYHDGTVLEGRVATDRICPYTTFASCASDSQFVAIDYTYGLQDYKDGILGMWSGNVRGYDTTEMFMYSLLDSGVIDLNIFSFYLTDQDGGSYIDFGEPNTSVMSDPNNILYLPIKANDYWWTSEVTGIRF